MAGRKKSTFERFTSGRLNHIRRQGTQDFEQRRTQRELFSLHRKATVLGYKLVQQATGA